MIVYGATIKSDIGFPLKLSLLGATRYDVELSESVPAEFKNAFSRSFPFYRAHGRVVLLHSDRDFHGSEAGQPWRYEVKGVVSFYWVGGERTIYYELAEEGDANLLSFWFIHLLLPLYFTLEQMYDFLHAGAVEVDGKPVLFIAPSMGGKSTMTDYFIKKGHSLISDDKVATFIESEHFMAVASHPYHRPYRRFEELGYHVENATTEFKPIHAFYAFEKSDADAEVTLEEIKGFEKYHALLPNYLYKFSYMKTERLHYLSSMLNSIRMFRLQVPWDMQRLDEVHDVICRHSKSL